MGARKRNFVPKGRDGSEEALNAYPSSHPLYHFGTNRKAESGAAKAPAPAAGLFVRQKDALHVGLVDPSAGVLNFDPDHVGRELRNTNSDRTFVGELGAVPNEVGQHLTKALAVSPATSF